MKAKKIASFVCGAVLLATIFACGGQGTVCSIWELNAPGAVSVTQGNFVAITVDPTITNIDSYSGGDFEPGNGVVPPGMTIAKFDNTTLHIFTTSATPPGTYNLAILGTSSNNGLGGPCSSSTSEPISITVNP